MTEIRYPAHRIETTSVLPLVRTTTQWPVGALLLGQSCLEQIVSIDPLVTRMPASEAQRLIGEDNRSISGTITTFPIKNLIAHE